MYRFILLSLYVSSIWASPLTKQSKIHPMHLKGPRIINGEEAKLGQFPWQVALFIGGVQDGYETSWFCGGSIISEEWILTAGHCVYGAEKGRAASGTISAEEGVETVIADFILHENFIKKNLTNDIALIKLKTPLKFDDNTAPVALASDKLDAGVEVTISGWGLTSDDDFTISSSLNYVNLVSISTEACSDIYGELNKGIVCAVSPSDEVKSTCSGDSGGPVVVNADSDPVHVAIVSFGSTSGCEGGAPSGLTRTASYRSWIQENSGV